MPLKPLKPLKPFKPLKPLKPLKLQNSIEEICEENFGNRLLMEMAKRYRNLEFCDVTLTSLDGMK